MPEFLHQRHKGPAPLERPRELVIACVPMRSNVNISQIARTASAAAVESMVICGNASLIAKIARDATGTLAVDVRRTLEPVLRRYSDDGYRIVGLEQASHSQNMHAYRFERRTVLVVGNERMGLSDEILKLLDDVIEIPVYGLPHSYNAGVATSMAIYEYCRQFPEG